MMMRCLGWVVVSSLLTCGRSELDDTRGANMGASSGLIVFASNQKGPGAIAVDGSTVYWVNTSGGSIVSCATTGCDANPFVIVANEMLYDTLAVAAGRVYWVRWEKGVLSCSTTAGCAGAPTSLASKQINPAGLTVDATNVYWLDNGGNGGQVAPSVMACGTTGCNDEPPVLFSGGFTGMGTIATGGDHVYWSECESYDCKDAAVLSCPVEGCGGSPAMFAAHQHGRGDIVTHGANVFWSDEQGAVMTCSLSGCNGGPIVLAPGSYTNTSCSIAVDDVSVYWTNATDGRVRKCAITGCGGNPTTLASNQGSIAGIALDATSVYWTDADDGTVMKLTPK